MTFIWGLTAAGHPMMTGWPSADAAARLAVVGFPAAVQLSPTVWRLLLTVAGIAVLYGVGRVVVHRIRTSVLGLLWAEISRRVKRGEMDPVQDQPKSVNGMDRLLGPAIERDFPGINLREARQRAEQLLKSTLAALAAGDAGRLSEGGQLYREQVVQAIEQQRSAGLSLHCSQIAVHKTVISDYVKRDGVCEIVFQSALAAVYWTETASGAVQDGRKSGVTQMRYQLVMAYIQDASKLTGRYRAMIAATCPSCGAPVTDLGARQCAYCDAALEPIHTRVWTFVRYEAL